MCDICDGMTVAEIERRTDLLIRVHGFMIQQVEGPAPWTYTVGLRESCDAPDLVVLDGPDYQQAELLARLARVVISGAELSPRLLAALDVGLVEPFPEDLAVGLVAQWEARYSMAAQPGDFRQLILGASWED